MEGGWGGGGTCVHVNKMWGGLEVLDRPVSTEGCWLLNVLNSANSSECEQELVGIGILVCAQQWVDIQSSM